MLQNCQFEVYQVVGVHLRNPRFQTAVMGMTSLKHVRTQYFVVCRTNALWFPPALESP